MAVTNGGILGSCSQGWLGSFNCDRGRQQRSTSLAASASARAIVCARRLSNSSPGTASGSPAQKAAAFSRTAAAGLVFSSHARAWVLTSSAAGGFQVGALPNVSGGQIGQRRHLRSAGQRGQRNEHKPCPGRKRGLSPFAGTARRRAPTQRRLSHKSGTVPFFADAQGHDGRFHWFFPISRSRVMRKMRCCCWPSRCKASNRSACSACSPTMSFR